MGVLDNIFGGKNGKESPKTAGELLSLSNECFTLISDDKEKFKEGNVVPFDEELRGKRETALALVEMFGDKYKEIALEYNTDSQPNDIEAMYDVLQRLKDAYIVNIKGLELE